MRFVDAAFVAITNGRQLVADLNEIRDSWSTRIQSRKGSNSWRIAELLFTHPVIDANTIATRLNIATSNVYAPLEPLIEAGILTESTSRSRGRIWRRDEVLRALDAFAARAGRRGK